MSIEPHKPSRDPASGNDGRAFHGRRAFFVSPKTDRKPAPAAIPTARVVRDEARDRIENRARRVDGLEIATLVLNDDLREEARLLAVGVDADDDERLPKCGLTGGLKREPQARDETFEERGR